MKRVLLSVIAVLCLTVSVQAAGLTVSVMTEQIAKVDQGNSLGVEVGYFLGIDPAGAGLEPFIGCDWWPRWEDGEMAPPSVIVLGARQWFADIVDPNSAIPFIPGIFLEILNEDVQIKPYVGFRFSANIIDKDSGLMSIPVGIAVKTSPGSNSALRFEARYNDTFGSLSMIPDNRFDLYMGIFMAF